MVFYTLRGPRLFPLAVGDHRWSLVAERPRHRVFHVPRGIFDLSRAFFACVSTSCTVTWSSSDNTGIDISVAGRIPPLCAALTSCNTCTRSRRSCTRATDFLSGNLEKEITMRG